MASGTSTINDPLLLFKLTTLFWRTLAVVGSFTSLATLSTMSYFKSRTHPYTKPLIILASLFAAGVHIGIFLSPPDSDFLVLVDQLLDMTCILFVRFVLMFYPKDKTFEAAVFALAMFVDVVAIMNLLEAREFTQYGDVFRNLLVGAVVRVWLLYRDHGGISISCFAAITRCIHVGDLLIRLIRLLFN